MVLYITHAFIITRPFKLVRDLQHINRSSPAEGAGKESFFPLSHANGPLCVIQVNYNKHFQPSKSLPFVTLPFRSSIVALHLAKPSFLHGETPLVTDYSWILSKIWSTGVF